jgi:nucleoid-associated protein YgaU
MDPVIETAVVPPQRPEFVLTGADDSFWSISEQVYGSGAYYRALFRHNESKVLRPDQLRPGIQVNTPPLEVLQKRYPTDFPVAP